MFPDCAGASNTVFSFLVQLYVLLIYAGMHARTHTHSMDSLASMLTIQPQPLSSHQYYYCFDLFCFFMEKAKATLT